MDWNVITTSASALAPLDSKIQQSSVVNLFKLSKDCNNQADQNVEKSVDETATTNARYDDIYNGLSHDSLDESDTPWCDKDLQLWERDKAVVVESLMNRLRSCDDSARVRGKPDNNQERPTQSKVEPVRCTPDIVMSHELEMLVSWLDRHAHYPLGVTDDAKRIFVDNMLPLLSPCDANAHNFISFMLELPPLGDGTQNGFMKKYLRVSLQHLQKQAWGSLHLALLNTKGIFVDSLIAAPQANTAKLLSICVECANHVFPGHVQISPEAKPRNSEYYFFIAYLLFRAGAVYALRILIDKNTNGKVAIPQGIDESEYPPMFVELCQLLVSILSEKECSAEKQVLLGKFSSEYFPTKQTKSITLLGKGSNFYVLLLLSVIYPDYYAACDADSLYTKEDYIWYQIHIILSGSKTSLTMATTRLCHTLTQEAEAIKPDDPNVVERVLTYAYYIALAGGVMETMRLLMSAVQTSRVQAVALIFLVYFENSGILDGDDLTYIANSLWKLESNATQMKETHYLTQLAFNRKRNVSPELKIVLATILPQEKAASCMKYVISESFNDAVNTCFIGSSTTRNGMLMIGPLLQKLIKLATRRSAAKLAILLMAQYSAHVGLWSPAFKCFYCIQDVDNCVSVLEACCCYLYDNVEQNNGNTVTAEDLCVYFMLAKSLAPNNKRLLDLTGLFECIKTSVLVKKGQYVEAVAHAKGNRIFEGVTQVLRNESHQIYFNALVDFIRALKHLVANGQQPSTLLTQAEAHNLVDLLESAYQNCNVDKNRTVEAIHMVMTFVTIVPPKQDQTSS
ncbi:hypothetical protein BBOV_III005370 [Babesia bovis T2Bo]|uniref:Nuclear pore protein n=1 Tax=Babesia bovis TaxID=5865 RepID=A7ANG6_BABBO|nr:hypothetical protein BBOV_III005370 [Babesia bovis T2Bo]EDO08100.1 hypothetical protein BBOV_III005370 [Babesia bovis T2Bo]|eukprot:XP_001611668.1 hypothetical protein [Babesia bovis T2Bo]